MKRRWRRRGKRINMFFIPILNTSDTIEEEEEENYKEKKGRARRE